ncbi:MAG: sigma-70 family RNA polymerase sigma factor [Candidatus Omnitrophica bacterium]|nr:sigma-70 family RNA polymerase sigma factor [Candidatus Omnitrophota bacterium]
MDQTDEQLILDFQNTDNTHALETLFSRYKSSIFNFCYRLLQNRADAEDTTADVFITLFAKKYALRPNAKFSTWLYTVAKNNCFNKLRKKKRMTSFFYKNKKAGGYDSWDPPATNALPTEDAKRQEEADLVRQAVNNLPPNMKEAIILREYQKLSYNQIAEILDCSLDNVKVIIFRARARLRSALAQLLEEDHDET